MQKMIWIPDDVIKEIREAAYQERKSVSQYLVDLHKNSKVEIAGDVKVEIKPEVVKRVTKDIIHAGLLAGDKTILVPPPPLKEYSEEYRKKNPNERCHFPGCGKALKFNCGH